MILIAKKIHPNRLNSLKTPSLKSRGSANWEYTYSLKSNVDASCYSGQCREVPTKFTRRMPSTTWLPETSRAGLDTNFKVLEMPATPSTNNQNVFIRRASRCSFINKKWKSYKMPITRACSFSLWHVLWMHLKANLGK